MKLAVINKLSDTTKTDDNEISEQNFLEKSPTEMGNVVKNEILKVSKELLETIKKHIAEFNSANKIVDMYDILTEKQKDYFKQLCVESIKTQKKPCLK